MKMSSSETRIIKYAKISSEPVVIAMQEFRELDVSVLDAVDGSDNAEDAGESEQDAVSDIESAEPLIPMNEAIVQAAREEAQALLDAVRSEAGKISDQAAEEGHRLGYESGLKQGLSDGIKQGLDEAKNQMAAELRQAADKANALLAAAGIEAEQILTEAEPKIIELVLTISRKVIHEELAERPGVVLNLCL